jgi:glutamine amidotransferase
MTGGTRDVQATFWLLDAPISFLLQSESQPDGVGLGTFTADGQPSVWRKPVAAARSETFIMGAREVRSRTILSHIRHASQGVSSMENTHPFEMHGRLLAHNGIVGDLEDIRARLGPHAELVHGTTDSELLFALVTKRIEEHGGDVGAGITAAAREFAAELALYSLNMLVTTPTDLWALRYPESNELWILENTLGGMESDDGLEVRSTTMRVQSGAFSFIPATVIASEKMDSSAGWRMVESGELIHVDAQLNVTSTIAVSDPPAYMIDLDALSADAAATQREERSSSG